jgi:pSer/pThr/pTyr-binding forkhead associated (FHA) protein
MAAKQGAQEAPAATYLESDEDIRQALQARRAKLKGTGPTTPAGTPGHAPAEMEVQDERPVLRPPLGMLCILDDGKADGEWVRLRSDRTVIGRSEGDVRIPHDGLMSGRHAELVRQRTANGYRWGLVDLQSTNGTFVRIGSTLLKHENEVLIGGGRYRFEAGLVPPGIEAPGTTPQTTQAWTDAPISALVPSLLEITPTGPGGRVTLRLPEYWIGRDAQSCAIARPDDSLCNPRHARLYRDAKGHWHIENNKSLNGLWLRITEPMPLGAACQFRLGEQRFIFRVSK